jgi:predicted small metal-binding protein
MSVVPCECGFQARADELEALIALVREHAWNEHGMSLTHEDAMRLAVRANAAAPRPSRTEQTS